MNSAGSLTPIDLELGLRIRPEDVVALRPARRGTTASLDDYLDFLKGLDDPPSAILRARHGPQGNSPFEL
jgi:hypothetical protein